MREIVIDGAVIATMTEADVEAMKLTPETTWTESLAHQVESTLDHNAARRYLLKELGRRGLTSGHARTLLERRGHTAPTPDRVIDELIDDGWLDDHAAGESILAGILRKGPAAAAFLEMRLIDRGIPTATAASLAADATSDASEGEAAGRLSQILLPRYSRLTPTTAARRLAAALSRRGFSQETVSEIVEAFLEEQ
jgi:SOS response regulatory protein OraA/RecX